VTGLPVSEMKKISDLLQGAKRYEMKSLVKPPPENYVLLGNPVAHSLSPLMHNVALKKKGIKVKAIHQPVSEDPSGELVENIFEAFDQHESQMNAYHTLRGMREDARRGFWKFWTYSSKSRRENYLHNYLASKELLQSGKKCKSESCFTSRSRANG
jgi:hypothetical protein